MNPLLKYTITPSAIAYSASASRLSIVTLTITGTNEGPLAAVVSQISFSIPQGTSGAGTALTTDASIIGVTADPTTPWAAVVAGNATWAAVPLPPVVSVAPGQRISLVLSNVVVNQVAGTVTIPITEISAGGTAQTQVVVGKATQSSQGGEVPTIESFAANPAKVAYGGSATLSWKVANATSLLLQPTGTPLSPPGAGSVTLPVRTTTIFTLQAVGPGGSTSAPTTVTVFPASIASFAATPETPVAPGTPVTLQWATQFASSASIDQGVGPVPTSGTTVVHPTQTTVYTLTAQGLGPVTRSIAITVTGEPTLAVTQPRTQETGHA